MASNTGVYDYFRQLAGTKQIDVTNDTIKFALVSSAYTPNFGTDQFWSAASSALIGAAVTVSGITFTNGVFNCTAPQVTGLASGQTVAMGIFYKDTGTGSTSPLIYGYDGTFTVTVAANASSSATSITVDPLAFAIASGAQITFGAVTATLSGSASLGARTLSVNATSGSISQGTTGTAAISGAGLPLTTSGATTTVTFTPDSGSNHVFKV